MSLATLMLLAIALGTDAFSLCLGVGISGVRSMQMATISAAILVFHILMPLAGWYMGDLAGHLAGRAAGIAGAAILIYLGLRTLWNASRDQQPKYMVVSGWGIIALAASVSMDALSVGFTLGTREINLFQVLITLGAVAGLMSLAGLLLGRVMGFLAGRRAQLVGGLILLGIGVKLIL